LSSSKRSVPFRGKRVYLFIEVSREGGGVSAKREGKVIGDKGGRKVQENKKGGEGKAKAIKVSPL